MPYVCPRIASTQPTAALLVALALLAGAGGCNGRVGTTSSGDDGKGDPPESALTGAGQVAPRRSAATYSEAVLVEPDDAYAETCTGVVVAARVVLTAAHCVAFVPKRAWKVTAPHATGGVERRTARDGEPMDAAFLNLSPSTYAQHDVRDVAVIYLDEPFTSVKSATVGPTTFTVAKDAPPVYVSSVGRSAEGLEAGLALSTATMLDAATGSREAIAYTTARVTAEGESGGPLFVEGTHQLVAVFAGVSADDGQRELWSRLDGEVYTWLTQKVSAHGGWIPADPR